METITRFKADDGLIFETEHECLEYEFLCRNESGLRTCVAFDENLNEIRLKVGMGSDIEEIKYIYISSASGAFESVNELFEFEGYTSPREDGVKYGSNIFLIWNDMTLEWCNFNNALNTLTEIFNKLQAKIE